MNKLLLNYKKMWVLPLLSVALLVGCATSNQGSGSGESTPQQTTQAVGGQAYKSSSDQSEFLLSLRDLAQEGKVLGSEFALKQVIEDVINTYGEPSEQPEWHAEGKGIFTSYSDKQIEFGYNKGSEIFEIRSSAKALAPVLYKDLLKAYGKPDYEKEENGKKIVGYVVSEEYKMIFVLASKTISPEESNVEKYSVLYPAATVNLMADDPGREW